MEQRLRERGSASRGDSSIPRVPRDQPLPLSFGQERLWLLHALEPGVTAYNSAYLYHLRGALDVAALERALNAILARHEVLRTIITARDGDALQVIREGSHVALPVEPAPSLTDARDQARRAALAPFDLERDVLLRPRLFRIGDNAGEHVLLIAAHHIAWDAWSTQIFWHELANAYATALRNGDPLPASLPALAVQYADVAAWQRARLQGAALERLLQFWREQLRELPPLELPTDRPRPPELTYAGDVLEFTWPVDLRENLHALARADGASLFMVLLAGWSTLLQRLSNQEIVITGTAIAGRARRELESLIGFFVNTLALRVDCTGNPTFRELLQRVRATTLAAYDHEDLPFEKLVAELRVPRDPARHPVFQTALVLHSAAPPAPALEKVQVESLPRIAAHARFDLALTLTETADGLRGALEFSTDLFDAGTMRRWLGHLETLLRAATRQPHAAIDALPLLTDVERTVLLGAWSGAAAPYPREATVHELFEEHARATPEAVALIEGATRITYAELDARASEIARRLGDGVRGGFVAIDIERSINFVAAVLGILKAGAAYVPLLKDLPAARRRFIFEDTKAVAVVVDGASAGDMPGSVRVIDVGPDLASGPFSDGPSRTARTQGPALCAHASDPAYVMYTSGSTGRPKGVVLPHRGIVRLVRGETPSRYAAGQRFLLLASTAFDASTFELWAPLLNGATLVIFPHRWPEFDPLARVVREHGVTHLFLTAGLFNQVIDHRPDLLAGVTHLFTGGEAMSVRHATRVRELFPALRVTNCYGPTEITTYTVSHELMREETWPGGNVPIGRPVPNARCYVLDTRGEPAPIGVAGELHLGGDGLALGYLNLPELTAERFVVDRFVDAPAARMYRTGDRARWRADGTLEFFGRLDDQVKIRGYRIEPGEIDSVLTQHPSVRDAAVIVREDQPGELRLVGYVVPRSEQRLDLAEVRSFLADRLPDYMVPAAIVVLPHLPLTSNGKIDRRALPAPEASANVDGSRPSSAPPRTPTEETVAAVWRTVLPATTPGVHDNFFAVGGHSLLAMQATAQLGSALQRDVPLRWWFDCPTIALLAERIDHARLESAGTLPIMPVPRDRELPVSHEEQRLWFLHHALPDPATYHVTWGWRLRGPLDRDRLVAALATLMQRQEILRTAYANRNGQPVRLIEPQCAVPWRLEGVDHAAGAAGDLVLQRHIADEVRRAIPLEHAPLWRVFSLALAPDDHVLVFTAHHLICDEWSLPLFHAELAAAYAGASGALPQLSVQYADYAVWQRERVRSDAAMRKAREFWLQHLLHAPATLAFPVALPRRGSTFTGAGRRVYFPLSAPAATVLEELGREEHATSFVTWLAVYVALLARWSGQSDFVVGTPLARRERAELQPLIGFFLNTLPLRVRLRAGASFRELLREMHAIVLDAFAHGELPLDEIAAAQRGQRSAGGGALFNVMFVVHDDQPPALELPGMRAEALDLSTGTAKADLTLFIDRRDPRAPRGSIEFATDVLTPATIQWLMKEFQRTLETLAANPEQTIITSARAVEWSAARDARRANVPDGPAPPELERELLTIWRRVLRREDIGANDNFFEVGGHSLLAMQVVHEIQQQLGRTVAVAQLLAAPTVAGLARVLGGAAAEIQPGTGSAWKGMGHGVPYFHVPGMNGVEFLAPAIAAQLAPDRRWFDALQHPGVDGRTPPAQSIEAIAAELVRQMRAAQPRGPYALGGFCHGGLVAFEVARQLEVRGERVAALVMWDTFPYRSWRRRSAPEVFRVLRRRLSGPGAATFVADRWRFFWHRVHLGLQFLGRIVRGRLPGERGRIEARMISAGTRARRQYHPGVLHAPVLLVRSRDERVFREKLPQDGWAGAIVGPCQVVDLAHWHFHLLRAPAVSELAERTAEFLRKVERRQAEVPSAK